MSDKQNCILDLSQWIENSLIFLVSTPRIGNFQNYYFLLYCIGFVLGFTPLLLSIKDQPLFEPKFPAKIVQYI